MSDNDEHGIEATDHVVVDLNQELESTTTRIPSDPPLDLSLGGEDGDPPGVIPADIPGLLSYFTYYSL